MRQFLDDILFTFVLPVWMFWMVTDRFWYALALGIFFFMAAFALSPVLDHFFRPVPPESKPISISIINLRTGKKETIDF